MFESDTLVFMHGYMLDGQLMLRNGSSLNRPEVMWALDADGEPTLRGRATMAITVAINYNGTLILGCDASEEEGITDGMRTLGDAYGLNMSSQFAVLAGGPEFTTETLRSWLNEHAMAGQGATTADECERAIRLCQAHGIKRLIHVSSAWHMPRCIAEMAKAAYRMRESGETVPDIVAIADQSSPLDVLVLEPPQRLDRPRPIWHVLARRLFKIPENRLHAAEHEFMEFLKEFGA